MSWVGEVVHSFIEGLGDSLNFAHTLKHLSECKIAKWNAYYSILLNSLLLVGSFYILDKSVLSVRPMELGMALLRKYLLKTGNATNNDDQMASGSTFVDQAIWVILFHTLSVAVNINFFRRVTQASLEHVNIVTSEKDMKVTVRDAIYRNLLIVFTFVEGAVIRTFVPVIGEVFAFVLFCWMNAYYSFDTVWALQGLPLPQQMALLESHWAYFMGFGIPLAATSHFLPHLLGHIVWALVFPFFIIQTIGGRWAQPSKALKKFGPSKTPRIPIFQFSMWAANLVIKSSLRLLSRSGSDKVHRTQNKKNR